jgi:hypothetical protein
MTIPEDYINIPDNHEDIPNEYNNKLIVYGNIPPNETNPLANNGGAAPLTSDHNDSNRLLPEDSPIEKFDLNFKQIWLVKREI